MSFSSLQILHYVLCTPDSSMWYRISCSASFFAYKPFGGECQGSRTFLPIIVDLVRSWRYYGHVKKKCTQVQVFLFARLNHEGPQLSCRHQPVLCHCLLEEVALGLLYGGVE